MKPEGKALDIVVVGLGQAGGNLASEFYRRGYRALAFNTAQTDLSALEPGGVFPSMPTERCIYIGLDGYDGAGADPAYGRECVREHGERIKNAVMKQAQTADVVLLTAGLGGGTGSSLSEMIKVLEDENLPLVALMTLPSEGESGIHKVNAVRAINELVDRPLLGWIFVDNARIAALNPDVSIVDYYAHINGQIASPLDALNRLNERDELRAIRSFDGEDFRKLLLSGGVLNYGVAELPSISVEEVVGTIKDCVEASELMPSGFEMPRLSYLGFVIEGTETTLAATPISVFEEIAAQLKAETQGAAIYHGIYRSSEEQPTTLRMICATQSMPNRMREVLADAKREGQALGEKIREELPTLELGELADVELFRAGARSRPSERPRKGGRVQDVLDAMDRNAASSDPATEDGVLRKELADMRVPDPRGARRRPVPQTPKPAPQPQRPQAAPPRPQPARPAAPPPAASTQPQAQPAPQRRATEQPKPPARPAAEEEEDEPSEPARDIGTEEIDIVAELAQIDQDVSAHDVVDQRQRRGGRQPAPPANNGEAYPEIYDRLVAEYLHAKNPRSRDEVARRLEADSLSDQTVVRYYAVEAMSKLGRDAFANALLAATEDENESVRAIAVEALRR